MDALLQVILFFIIGLISGSFGGMLGIGGATILIPALTLGFGLPVQLAIAVSLVNNVAVSLTAAIRYMRMGWLHKNVVLIMNIASLPGILIGTLVSAYSPGSALKVLFGVFLACMVALSLAGRGKGEEAPVKEPEKINKPGFSILGFSMGLLGSLLGIGGGTLAVPVQTYLFKVPMKNAIANSLGTIVVASSAGAIIYFLVGAGTVFSAQEALLAILAIIPGSILGASGGALISGRISTKAIKYIFYLVMLYIAYNMIKSGLGW